MNYFIEPYNNALKSVLQTGFRTKTTYAKIDQEVTFNLEPLNTMVNGFYSYKLALPLMRGTYKTALKYALAEAVWYKHATRKIDLIKDFGPIWERMADDKGLVNSNYGYQISRNQNFEDKLTLLLEKDQISYMIASEKNMWSTNDLVCNNRVDVQLTEFMNGYILDARVVARSIDLIMGLPYDMFAAQGFLATIATRLQQRTHKPVKLRQLSFEVANLHWYFDHNPGTEALNCLSNEVITIPYNETPFANNTYKELTTSELIKEYRDKQMAYRTVEELAAKPLSQKIEGFRSKSVFTTLTGAVSGLTQAILQLQPEDAEDHLRLSKEIFWRLINDPFERKTMVVVGETLIYLMVEDGKYVLMIDKLLPHSLKL